jgi:hypothetical protein
MDYHASLEALSINNHVGRRNHESHPAACTQCQQCGQLRRDNGARKAKLIEDID